MTRNRINMKFEDWQELNDNLRFYKIASYIMAIFNIILAIVMCFYCHIH